MKIHSLGSDYAHQRKQKQMDNQVAEKSSEQPKESEEIPETDAGDQVQNRGEREAVATAVETDTLPKKAKAKKEMRSENKQPEE